MTAIQTDLKMQHASSPAVEMWSLDWFSKRERRVLALVADGLSNKSIATDMEVAESTVKLYVTRLLKKCACTNRVQLALIGFCLLNGRHADLDRLLGKIHGPSRGNAVTR